MNLPDLRNPVDRVRFIGMAEGVSFLLLLGVAMPLKYLAGMDKAVTYTGWAHGGLFVLFLLVILLAWLDKAIPFRHAALAFGASLIPFGPFLIDRHLVADKNKS